MLEQMYEVGCEEMFLEEQAIYQAAAEIAD